MTPQEIFDTVSNHLLNPNTVRAYDSLNNSCMYRTCEGNKCAVGILIPDEVYTKDMEFMSVGKLIHKFSGILPPYFSKNISLLRELQAIHDDDVVYWEPTKKNMKEALKGIAMYFGLKVNFDV